MKTGNEQSGLTSAATERVAPFFVTGLPRSRTGWLAAWLSTPGALYAHDVPVVRDAPGVAGYSGSELLMDFARLRDDYPKSQWLFVLREPGDVERSLRRWAGRAIPLGLDIVPFLEHRSVVMENSACTIRHGACGGYRTVYFDDLSNVQTAQLIWEFLKPGIAFETKRFFLFDSLNIQQRRPSWL